MQIDYKSFMNELDILIARAKIDHIDHCFGLGVLERKGYLHCLQTAHKHFCKAAVKCKRHKVLDLDKEYELFLDLLKQRAALLSLHSCMYVKTRFGVIGNIRAYLAVLRLLEMFKFRYFKQKETTNAN